MSADTDTIRKLIALGLTADQIGSVLEILESMHVDRNVKNRERVRRWRERLGLSATEWRDLSNAIRQRDNYTCAYCGSQEESMHVDHVLPLIQGGTNDPENLATACKACNSGKSGRTLDQWRGHQ